MQTLTKAWNKAPAGTEITDDPAEAKKGGKKVVLVDSARLAHLAKHGFFRARKAEDAPEEKLTPGKAPDKSVSIASLAKEGKNVIDRRLDIMVDPMPRPLQSPEAGPASQRSEPPLKGNL